MTVRPDSTASLRIVLDRLVDLPAAGWYSGDLHVHMNYGGAYRNDPRNLAFQARAEDLHLVENLIVNKEGRVPDIGYFSGRPDPVSTAVDADRARPGVPHQLLGPHRTPGAATQRHPARLRRLRRTPPPRASTRPTPPCSTRPTRRTALTGYVHPFDSYPDPADSTKPLTHELPVDVALGKVDYYEAIGFVDDYEATARVWYRLLNCGFRLPAGAGTDAMANFASLRGPVGMNRVFAKIAGPLDHRRWLAALKAGRTFATNGPLLGFTLEGKELGGELAIGADRRELVARVTLNSIVPVDRLEIVRNGEVDDAGTTHR